MSLNLINEYRCFGGKVVDRTHHSSVCQIAVYLPLLVLLAMVFVIMPKFYALDLFLISTEKMAMISSKKLKKNSQNSNN